MESRLQLRRVIVLMTLTVLVFLSRVPFLNAGYGLDPDAWRIVHAGHEIATTGTYTASRLPGYPLPEITSSLFANAGVFIVNGVSATLSAVAFLFFALSLEKLGSKAHYWSALALSFTPSIYVNSTNSMDYVWALAFVLVSFFFVLDQRPFVAGIFLSLAVASRITSVLALAPLCIVAVYARSYTVRQVMLFCATTLFISTLFFVPVMERYGWGFLSYYETVYPNILIVLYRMSVGVWGIVGLCAIVFLVLLQFVRSSKLNNNPPINISKPVAFASLLAICFFVILYVRLPHDSGYLIPAVPFVILLLGKLLARKDFVTACLAIIVSPFLLSFDTEGISLKGPIIRDHERRIDRIELVQGIIAFGRTLPDESVIVSGPYLPQIQTSIQDNPDEKKRYVYLLSAVEIQSYVDKQYNIYYLPGMDSFNLQIHGVDLSGIGKPIPTTGVR